MTPEQSEFLSNLDNVLCDFWDATGTPQSTAKSFILTELQAEFAMPSDGECGLTDNIVWLAFGLRDIDMELEILHELLVMPCHYRHQDVTRKLQDIGCPSSIPHIAQALAGGFHYLEYTCSEDGVIAKWFSHALASIGTDEAIDLIRKYARSTNPEVAEEMQYRLTKCLR